jgi:hypothetical protein
MTVVGQDGILRPVGNRPLFSVAAPCAAIKILDFKVI